MGFKFFYVNECAYMHLQTTVCMHNYTHITYVKSEKLLSDIMKILFFIVE